MLLMKQAQKTATTTKDLVFGVSIIILALVVTLLAHSVITGKDFMLSGAPHEGVMMPIE